MVALEEMAGKTQSFTALEYIGISTDFGKSLPQGARPESDHVKDMDELSQRAMMIWISCVRHRVGSMMYNMGFSRITSYWCQC